LSLTPSSPWSESAAARRRIRSASAITGARSRQPTRAAAAALPSATERRQAYKRSTQLVNKDSGERVGAPREERQEGSACMYVWAVGLLCLCCALLSNQDGEGERERAQAHSYNYKAEG
jgi:hypothetical protein